MRRHKIPCDCKEGAMAVLCNTWEEYFVYWCRNCCRQIKLRELRGGETVSRQAHNLETAGSTPAPATNNVEVCLDE